MQSHFDYLIPTWLIDRQHDPKYIRYSLLFSAYSFWLDLPTSLDSRSCSCIRQVHPSGTSALQNNWHDRDFKRTLGCQDPGQWKPSKHDQSSSFWKQCQSIHPQGQHGFIIVTCSLDQQQRWDNHGICHNSSYSVNNCSYSGNNSSYLKYLS